MHNDKTIQDYAIPFAAWEVRLFLDTHPNDKRALAAYRQLCLQSKCESNYACLPESYYTPDCWNWIDDPWPWEPEANCVSGRTSANQMKTARIQQNQFPGRI